MRLSAFSKTYDGKTVLKAESIEIQPGRIYAVVGANGSGKSTFGRVVSGIEKADGNVKPIKGALVGYMPQKSFAFSMSVKKNVLLNGTDSDKADELIRKTGLEALTDKNAKKLSGGETSRMALARIMMKDYELLILDEPSASMDMESTLITESLIKEYVEKTNAAVLLITHSLQQARRVSDETLFFDKGIIEETGPTNMILKDPKNEKTKRFIEFYGV